MKVGELAKVDGLSECRLRLRHRHVGEEVEHSNFLECGGKLSLVGMKVDR